MSRREDEKMRYRPPLLEEPCAQTLSGIKQEARKDKKEHLRKELEELEGNARSGLKRLRNRSWLKFTKFNFKDGGRIPRSQYPHKAAEYLSSTGAIETKPRKLAKTKAQPRMFDKRGIPNQ